MDETSVPSESKPTPLGFCWVEIPVKDMQRALKFYSDAFGWVTKSPEKPESPYQIVENPFKNLNGALCLVPEDDHVAGTATRTTIKPYLGLNSVQEALAKVKEAGGEIINGGEAIPGDMGYTGEFYDSERNVVGVYAMKLNLDS
ncbi:hypothetical protein TWF694_003240 [Orbilia ellipsospora]|uniref:VOC domain-containing protein n=1 Tax=Orbilia ellipsospora TaxID=2528407 RepID=A0AAV9X106_9PEZI